MLFTQAEYCFGCSHTPDQHPKSPQKRVQTWEEVTGQREEQALAKAAAVYAANADARTEANTESVKVDEENAAPEEGELPDE